MATSRKKGAKDRWATQIQGEHTQECCTQEKCPDSSCGQVKPVISGSWGVEFPEVRVEDRADTVVRVSPSQDLPSRKKWL